MSAATWPAGNWEQIAARDPDWIVVADLTRGGDGDSAQAKIDFLRSNPLTATPAFAAFQAELGERLAEGPLVQSATVVGSYGFPLAAG